MFNSITGILTEKSSQNICVDCNGIEFDIAMSRTSISLLGETGETCHVYVYLQHSDTAMTLFGFASKDEREVFLQLLKVSGVGPRSAIKILSSVTSKKLMSLIDSGDAASLQKIPGISKNCASKIILALKGKLVTPDLPGNVPNEFSVVIDSVASMGYERQIVAQKLNSVLNTLQKDANFCALSSHAQEDEVFKKLLTSLV